MSIDCELQLLSQCGRAWNYPSRFVHEMHFTCFSDVKQQSSKRLLDVTMMYDSLITDFDLWGKVKIHMYNFNLHFV